MPRYEVVTDQGTFEIETDTEVTSFSDLDLSSLTGGSGFSNSASVADLNNPENIDPASPFHPGYGGGSDVLAARNAMFRGATGALDLVSNLGRPRVAIAGNAELDEKMRQYEAKNSLGGYVQKGLQAIGLMGEEGDPTQRAYTPAGQVAEVVAESLPVALASGPGGVTPTLTGALGSGIAKASGANEGVQLAAGLAAPLSLAGAKALATKGRSTLSSLFTQAGKDAQATADAKRLIAKVSDPNAAIASLEKAAAEEAATPWIVKQQETYLPQYQRTAEITGQPGLASLESVLQKTGLKGEIGSVATVAAKQDAARELGRNALATSVLGPSMLKADRGEIIRSGLAAGDELADAVVKKYAAKAFPPGATIQTPLIKGAITSALNTATRKGDLELSPDFMKLIEKIRELPKDTAFERIQGFRSDLGKWANPGIAATQLDRQTARVAAQARGAMDKAINQAVKSGDLPKSQKAAWAKMIAARRERGTTYGSGKVLDALEKDAFNTRFNVPDENVAMSLFSKRYDAKQAVAALASSPQGKDQLRKSLIADIWGKAWNSTEQKVKGATLKNELQNYSNVIPDLLTKPQQRVFNLIAKDVESQTRNVSRSFTGTPRNSSTPEILTQIQVLQKAIVDPTTSAIRKMIKSTPVLGHIADAMIESVTGSNQRQALLNKKLADFALNPKYAVELLKTPTKISPTLLGEFAKELGASVPGFADAFNRASQSKEGTFILSAPAPSLEPEADITQSLFTPTSSRIDMDSTINNPLVQAVVWQESRGKPGAVSSKGATGLMQIMPATAKEIAAELGIEKYDLKDPATNLQFGEYYLNKMLDTFGDERLALAAYNAGPGNVKKWVDKWGADWDVISNNLEKLGQFRETRNYVPSILKKRAEALIA